MTTSYQMQACSSADGVLYSWVAPTPDWGAASFPGPGVAQDVALSGGGFINVDETVDGAIVDDFGAFVLDDGGDQVIEDVIQIVDDGGLSVVDDSGELLTVG